MRRLLALAVAVFAAPALAEAPAPELLERLAAWAERTNLQTAVESVTIRTVSEELNGEGRVEHTDDVVMKFTYPGGDQAPKSELISATRDGADDRERVLEKQRDREDKAEAARREGKKPEGSFAGAIPFSREHQGRYVFELLPPFADDPTRLRIGFSPRGKASREIFIGEAKVDAERGAVLWLQERPSELPALVQRFHLEMFFGSPSAAGPVLSEIRLRGEGGVLMLKKRFRATLRFSDVVLRKPSS